MYLENKRDILMLLLAMIFATLLAELLFYLHFLYASKNNIFFHISFNWNIHNTHQGVTKNGLLYVWYKSFMPIAVTTFFLWRLRFSTRFANVFLACGVLSFATATYCVIDYAYLKLIAYFIVLNNLVFLPFVIFMPTAHIVKMTYLNGEEAKIQNRRYGLLFGLIVVFGGAFAGIVISVIALLLYIIRHINSIDLSTLSDFLLISLVSAIYGVYYGAIPSLLLAWAVIIFRLQRNFNGVFITVLTGIALATLYGALIIYTSNRFSAKELWMFTVGGGGVAIIVAYFLPKPIKKLSKQGISALVIRKKMALIVFAGATTSVLLLTSFDLLTNMDSFVTNIGVFYKRAFLATIKKYADISLGVLSVLAWFYYLSVRNKTK